MADRATRGPYTSASQLDAFQLDRGRGFGPGGVLGRLAVVAFAAVVLCGCRSPRALVAGEPAEGADYAGTYVLEKIRPWRLPSHKHYRIGGAFRGARDASGETHAGLLSALRRMFPRGGISSDWTKDASASIALDPSGRARWRSDFAIGREPVVIKGRWTYRAGVLDLDLETPTRAPGTSLFDLDPRYMRFSVSAAILFENQGSKEARSAADAIARQGLEPRRIFVLAEWGPDPDILFDMTLRRSTVAGEDG